MSADVVMLEAHGQGGVAQYTYLLASALVEAGVRPHVVTRAGWELAARPRAFEVTPLLGAAQPYLASARAIHALVRDRRPSIFHVQAAVSTRKDGLILAWLRRLGPRVVVTAHNAVPHEARWLDVLGAWGIYHAADHVIAHNEATRREIATRFRVAARRLSVIPLGDYGLFAEGAPTRQAARAHLALGADEPVVLFFGAVRPYKGLDVLIDAFARVRTRVPRCRLVVAGEVRGGDVSACLTHAARLGVDGAMTVTDRYLAIEEVARYLRAADVAVFPYRRVWESASVRVAIALGCPVVASDVGGLAEIVRDGESGRLVPPGDAEALARAIHDTLADPAAAAARAARALDAERRLRAWPGIAARTAELYRRLTTERVS